MNCDHGIHDTLLVKTKLGFSMNVYNWSKYGERSGRLPDLLAGDGFYCQGQDYVSECIDKTGLWEEKETRLIFPILGFGDREKLVLDFGSHVGFYVLLAGMFGYTVNAYDCDSEQIRICNMNIALNNFSRCTVFNHKIDKNSFKLPVRPVQLLKCDLEGFEPEALDMTREMFERGLVEHALFEISPIFHGGYPRLVKEIMGYGYSAIDTSNLSEVLSVDEYIEDNKILQTNFLFSKA